jgi:hypothetical protein
MTFSEKCGNHIFAAGGRRKNWARRLLPDYKIQNSSIDDIGTINLHDLIEK